MSNIVLQPNASGTGNITIATPNTNTDRTLNIPDVAGDIVTTGDTGTVTAGMVAGINTSALPTGTVLQVVSRNFQASQANATNTTYGNTPEAIIDGYQTELQVKDANSKILIIMGIHLMGLRDGPSNAHATIGFDSDASSGVSKSASDYTALIGGNGLYQNRRSVGYGSGAGDIQTDQGFSTSANMTYLHTHGQSVGTYLYYTAMARTSYTNSNPGYDYFVQNPYNTITLMEIK